MSNCYYVGIFDNGFNPIESMEGIMKTEQGLLK